MVVSVEPDMFALDSRYHFTSNPESTSSLSANEKNKLEAVFEIQPLFEEDFPAYTQASNAAKNAL